MDCSTCRSCFSQTFDERLAGERRQEFTLHLQACQTCDAEYSLYRRVFSTIRGLPDGEAQPFKAPAEVPGALSRLATPSASPRLARVAAGFLILIGLVGTHVLVFQWSKDHASRQRTERVAPVAPALTTSASLNAVLPSALRDHVDATDLFIRTADKLPDEASARDVAAADWDVSNLPRLTEELRKASIDVSPEVKPWVDRYLQDAEENFIPNMRRVIETGTYSVREIRNAVADSSIRSKLDRMKLFVASMPRGASFSAQPTTTMLMNLKPDGRRLIESKYARLAGHFPRAIEGFEGFDAQFPKSRLAPAAAYLQFEALNAAGMPARAFDSLGRSGCIPLSGHRQEVWRQVFVFIHPRYGPTWASDTTGPEGMQDLSRLPSGGMITIRLGGGNPPSLPLKCEAIVPQIEPLAPESRPAKTKK